MPASARRARPAAVLPGDAYDFLPGPLRLVTAAPSPLPRRILYWLTALAALGAAWLVLGRLDIVAVASGKLVPRTSLRIVQPLDAGRIAEIAVSEGESVIAGQVLVRLDADLQEADTRALHKEIVQRTLQLRRIDAEADDAPLARAPDDSEPLFARVEAQYRANRAAYGDALAQERAAILRIREELRAARAVHDKLVRTVPIYRTTADRYSTLQREGFVSELAALERQRERIEKEHDLTAQAHAVEGLEAGLAHAERRLAQVTSAYRQQLHAERAQALAQKLRLDEDLAKAVYRAHAVELRAPQAGVVKDLLTHTFGAVVAPGTVLLSLVPAGEELQADVLVRNLDVGFVRVGQSARIKVATYPFHKYGIVDGVVVHVSPDAIEPAGGAPRPTETESGAVAAYRARIALGTQRLAFDDRTLPLVSGMLVEGEIRLGERTLLEYLLAPVQKAWHDAARER
ncbi:MAG: HlyD family type I secretion periplasmic adaptor subunit [Burkholderiales bacterium]|nr:HlyD family type I secretion periplasmic adaptor subunit [Burkholderiales bacterium]